MSPPRAQQFRNHANIGFLALAFAVILGTSIISVRSTRALADSILGVTHIINVMDNLANLQVELGMLEANGLHFMIGGAANHRAGVFTHLDAVDRAIARLKIQTAGSARHRATLTTLTQDYQQLQSRARISIAIKDAELRDGEDGSAIERIRDGRGESAIDRIREHASAMSLEEKRQLTLQRQARDALVKQTTYTLMIANGLALFAGLLGFVALRRAQHETGNALRGELRAAQARRVNEEKSVFLASMSHEIRTPMNAIFGFAQLLGDHVREPLHREWVASIKKSGQMLLGLINDVLDLSKVEAGKLQLNPHGTDVSELATETLALFEPMAEAKGVRLQIEIDSTDLVPVVVDSQRLRQILMNLLSNAVKYTECGEVTLRLAMTPSLLGSGRDLRMVVTDSGVGIEPGQLEHIFEPFYQAESPDGRVRQGTGLGLSITRRLVDLMHGSIHVVSRRGAGATFRVDIPGLEPAAVVETGEGDARVDFNQLPVLNIVLVDDVEWNLEVAQGYLRGSHHRLAVARDGVEGLDLVRKLKPDVVLMDLRMPRMNGYRAFEAIRADATLDSTRVVAVTASSLAGEDNAQTRQFDAYIRKPYAPLDLFVALSDLFGRGEQGHNSAAETAVSTPGQDTPAPTVERLADVHNEWRTLCGEPLQALRGRMRMREIGEFTQRLETLAEEIRDPQLQTLARRLRVAIQRFDVNQVKLVLGTLAVKCDESNDAE